MLYSANFLISLGIFEVIYSQIAEFRFSILFLGLASSYLISLLLIDKMRTLNFSIMNSGWAVISGILIFASEAVSYYEVFGWGGNIYHTFAHYFLLCMAVIALWTNRISGFSLYRVRGVFILAGLFAGVVGALLTYYYSEFWVLWSGLFFGYLVSFLFIVYLKQRTPFLRLINGKLAGRLFGIDREIYHIGSSLEDNLRLSSYYGVLPSHAKVVSYQTPSRFVLVANAFDSQLSINFREVDEQILEDGDIISIGGAKAQFFTDKEYVVH